MALADNIEQDSIEFFQSTLESTDGESLSYRKTRTLIFVKVYETKP